MAVACWNKNCPSLNTWCQIGSKFIIHESLMIDLLHLLIVVVGLVDVYACV